MKMNLPNRLTVARLFVVPIYMTVMFLPIDDLPKRIIAAALFLVTAFTDFLDGHIARKRGLVTDFGRFLDPVADKIMIFSAMCGLIVMNLDDKIFVISVCVAAFVFFLREIAVTSLRMIASSAKGVVIAAGILGKVKTVSQIVFVMIALLEPLIMEALGTDLLIGTYFTMIFMSVMTVVSGIGYFKAYFPLIDPEK
ncbi:MAG: CDP-diacylglycerol--glycerol-3-phosphate 3-phosphatidyltransferase [Ruminococcaceae bacterium]|nr:CDP-diacylglycerol--glycerol-3-phosphate 3-phosphatidyltransferase [Oscillospiraceae bacterium]